MPEADVGVLGASREGTSADSGVSLVKKCPGAGVCGLSSLLLLYFCACVSEETGNIP